MTEKVSVAAALAFILTALGYMTNSIGTELLEF
jgi:hypothetical protein